MTTRKMILVKATGEVRAIEVPYGSAATPILNQAVGGWLEMIHIGDRACAYLNEEGKLHALEYNPIATMFWRIFGSLTHDDVLVGNVVVTGPMDGEGFHDDVPEVVATYLLTQGAAHLAANSPRK